ncbi:MAG: response regulator [Bacteroidota bacterium]|nr:response regulator [Bacteroidota bacterium]
MSNPKNSILIVDDSKTNLLALSDLLSKNNLWVYRASTGNKAVEFALRYKPDIILLDIVMPEPDGFEVCNILKSDVETKDIPLIFLTGKDKTDDIVKGFEMGAVDYITKPFQKEVLLARVTTHLELKKSRDIIHRQNILLKAEARTRKQAEKKLAESQRKYSSLITGLNDAVFRITYPEGKYEYISPGVKKVFGYSKANFYKSVDFIKKIIHPEYLEYYSKKLETSWGVAPTLKYKIIDPEGNDRWIIQANKGTFDREGNLIAIEGIYRNISTKQELVNKKDALEKINNNLTSSIRYAQVIQQAVLPSPDFWKQFIPDYFILYLPRDIVSGDFYWIKQVNNYVAVVSADCTGHGVPGAFMSMLGVALLNEIVRLDKKPKANKILDELRQRLKISLHQDRLAGRGADGMDMSLCIIDIESKELQYAGANSPAYILRKEAGEEQPNLINLSPDRMPVGLHLKERPFNLKTFQMETDDILYLFSDGFVDQFGGEKSQKYKPRRFRELLKRIFYEPMQKQQELLFKEYETWRGGTRQLDDILVMGFKIQDNYGNIDFFDHE